MICMFIGYVYLLFILPFSYPLIYQTKMLFRRAANVTKSSRCFSAAAAAALPPSAIPAADDLSAEPFRTNENSPSKQSLQQTAKFYRQSPEVKKQLFTHGGIPKTYDRQLKTFGESCLMVRQPAIELIHYIRTADLSKPANRYVLYGKDGVGKSLTLNHVLHYGHENDFVIVHVPWVPNWFKKPKEKANSITREGCIDLPIDAAAWLIHFKLQNAHILPRLGLKCSRDYVWSKRETTPAGATLLELIEHGIARIKFASDTVAVLLEELKEQSTAGRCKTMVAIDGYNAFFYPETLILTDHRAKVTPEQVTLTRPFLNITDHDWCNGVCVLVVDRLALNANRMESELPRYLLGKEGFEHLDPMVPIRVDNYDQQEFDSCIDYYVNRKWIQSKEPGFDKELQFLSNSNPYSLMQLCRSL